MSSPTRTQSRIPDFTSIEEAAAFWDSHDSSEFEDEWEPVEVEVSPDLRSVRVVEIELDDETADQLFALARQRGVKASELAGVWLRDALTRAMAEAGRIAPARRNGTD